VPAKGAVKINGVEVNARDGVAIEDVEEIKIEATPTPRSCWSRRRRCSDDSATLNVTGRLGGPLCFRRAERWLAPRMRGRRMRPTQRRGAMPTRDST